jgi:hypothetical protein
MSPQEHVWACALAIERQHGTRAAVVVAERIGALALAGDREGIAMWKAIAACLDELIKAQNGTQGH